MSSRAVAAVIVAVGVLTGCGNDSAPGGSTSATTSTAVTSPSDTSVGAGQPGGQGDKAVQEISFDVAAVGSNTAEPQPEPAAVAVGDVAVAWSSRSEVPVPEIGEGQVAVVVDAGSRYRNTVVKNVTADSGGNWSVAMQGNAAEDCAGVDVVLAESHLLVVSADTAPETVQVTMSTNPGC